MDNFEKSIELEEEIEKLEEEAREKQQQITQINDPSSNVKILLQQEKEALDRQVQQKQKSLEKLPAEHPKLAQVEEILREKVDALSERKEHLKTQISFLDKKIEALTPSKHNSHTQRHFNKFIDKSGNADYSKELLQDDSNQNIEQSLLNRQGSISGTVQAKSADKTRTIDLSYKGWSGIYASCSQ